MPPRTSPRGPSQRRSRLTRMRRTRSDQAPEASTRIAAERHRSETVSSGRIPGGLSTTVAPAQPRARRAFGCVPRVGRAPSASRPEDHSTTRAPPALSSARCPCAACTPPSQPRTNPRFRALGPLLGIARWTSLQKGRSPLCRRRSPGSPLRSSPSLPSSPSPAAPLRTLRKRGPRSPAAPAIRARI